MNLTNKVKDRIVENIRIFIPNHKEFFDQFNEHCIIYGKYLLHYINDDDVINNTINIITNMSNFKFLHHFLSDNHFNVTQFNANDACGIDLVSLKKLTTDTIIYEKYVGDYVLNVHVIKTANVHNYLGFNIKLKIEQNYYNGSLVILPFKKCTLLKYEENDKIKLNDFKLLKKITYYVNNGYTFKIATDSGNYKFKPNNYSKCKYYLHIVKYYLHI